MKAALFASVLATATLLSVAAQAQESGPFDKWLSRSSPQCVPVADFKSVAQTIQLTQDQFEFVRALFVAIPPMSTKLPPGDHAVLATANNQAMLALVGDNVSCARFLAPDFVVVMLIEVGGGDSGAAIGQAASLSLYR
jgi:hypothetical protein